MEQLDEWVSQEFQNLAQVINEFDSHLWLEMVPADEQRNLIDKSKVFRIVDDRINKPIMYADSLSTPTDILARLWDSDNTNGDVVKRMDARNAAIQALELSRQIDEQEARIDFSAFVFKNTKSTWTHEGRKRDDEFRDLGPVRKVIT